MLPACLSVYQSIWTKKYFWLLHPCLANFILIKVTGSTFFGTETCNSTIDWVLTLCQDNVRRCQPTWSRSGSQLIASLGHLIATRTSILLFPVQIIKQWHDWTDVIFYWIFDNKKKKKPAGAQDNKTEVNKWNKNLNIMTTKMVNH